jgi:hypothetical protein
MAVTFYFLILPQQCAFPAERYDEGKSTAIQMIDPLHHQISPGPEQEETGESTP